MNKQRKFLKALGQVNTEFWVSGNKQDSRLVPGNCVNITVLGSVNDLDKWGESTRLG